MVDWSRAKRTPFKHQVEGVRRIVAETEPQIGRTIPGVLFLADDMRLGKTKQAIDSSIVLFEQVKVDTVIVVCPSYVRDVWFDEELGEIAKHAWDGVPILVVDYHNKMRKWSRNAVTGQPYLKFIITNYEYIRYGLKRGNSGWSGPYVKPLLGMCGPKTMVVFDESMALADPRSLQSRAAKLLRDRSGRVLLLNGTPMMEGSPENLFGQLWVMDSRILGLKNVGQLRAKYAEMGGHLVEIVKYGKKIMVPVEVLGWRHKKREGCCDIPPYMDSPLHDPSLPGVEDLQKRIAPYILRRERKDCLDLPPKLDPVTMTVSFKPETWRFYKQLQDDLVAWLDANTLASVQQAGVKVMRLAQLAAGFLAGLTDEMAECPLCAGSGIFESTATSPLTGIAALLSGPGTCPTCGGLGISPRALPPREVGSEKLSLVINWVKKRMREDPQLRMLIWCRFRPELFRIVEKLRELDTLTVGALYGGQTPEERSAAIRLVHPEVQYSGPSVLVAIESAGRGWNAAGAHEVIYTSNDPSLMIRQQSEDRPHGLGQTHPIAYGDVVITGPKGEKTIDHIILKNLRTKKDMATYTCSAWKTELLSVE